MKYEDDIHNCTNERLAEMLDFLLPRLKMPEERAVISEAAARLRTKHKEHFNSEAFEWNTMKIGCIIEYADNGMILYNKDNKVVVPHGESKSTIGFNGTADTNLDECHRKLGKMLLDELEADNTPCGGYVLDIKVKYLKQ